MLCKNNRKSDSPLLVRKRGRLKAVHSAYQPLQRKSTDQGQTRVCPVEFNAHIELSGGRAAEHQPLPRRQPGLCRGQGEIIDFVSCGKGRADTGVSRRPIVLLRLQTVPVHLLSLTPCFHLLPPSLALTLHTQVKSCI